MATESEALLTIGQVAQRAGIRVSHIRYYEEIGVLPEAERVSGQRRYRDDVLHRLSIIDVAQRAGLTLDEIRHLTGPDNRGADASLRIRELAERKLPDIDALIERAQAVRRWLEVAQGCDCTSVDVCRLFIDPALAPPPGDVKLSIRQVGVRE
jgi:MerR family redox-sensitive transcriptional activator SoxR